MGYIHLTSLRWALWIETGYTTTQTGDFSHVPDNLQPIIGMRIRCASLD